MADGDKDVMQAATKVGLQMPERPCLAAVGNHRRAMKYRVTLIDHDEGVSVSCPALRGCHSQGKTREEALANIQEAIREWLAAEADEAKIFKVSEAEVAV